MSPKLPSLHICAVGSGVVALWARTVLRRLSVSHATVRTIKGEPLLVFNKADHGFEYGVSKRKDI